MRLGGLLSAELFIIGLLIDTGGLLPSLLFRDAGLFCGIAGIGGRVCMVVVRYGVFYFT